MKNDTGKTVRSLLIAGVVVMAVSIMWPLLAEKYGTGTSSGSYSSSGSSSGSSGYKKNSGYTSSYDRHKKCDPYDAYDYDDADDDADDWAEEFGDGDYDDGYDDAYD